MNLNISELPGGVNLNVKIVLQILLKLLFDEESREKLINVLIVTVVLFISLIAFPIYFITNPLEVFASIFGDGGAKHTEMVSDFQVKYGYYGEGMLIDISGDYIQNEIPLFIQWDKRWNLCPYGNSTIGIGGCGPTSLAMVIVGLTGDTNINPKIVADYSAANGYRIDGVGTSWGLFTSGAINFGLKGTEISRSAENIISSLKNGNPIISSMKPGHFTSSGHFIVLTGINENGKIIVNDPNSTKLSSLEWDISLIINESKGMWSFEKLRGSD